MCKRTNFFPQGITNYLVLCDFDSQEQESYAVLLHNDNFENDLDATIADTKIEADQLHRKCVYSNINNKR